MVRRRGLKGQGTIYRRHDSTCPPADAAGERPDHDCHGPWRVRYADIDPLTGRQRVRVQQFRTLKEAQRHLADLRDERATGSDITLERWMAIWLDEVAPQRVRANTVDGYRQIAGAYITPVIGHVKLSDLGAEHVRKLHSSLRTYKVLAKKPDPKTGKRRVLRVGLSDTMVGHVHSVLRQALQQAQEERRVEWNPAAVVHPPQPDPTHYEQPTFGEIRQLADAAQSTRELARVLVAFHGLRPGEVLALDWRNVHEDDPAPWLMVAGSVRPVRGAGLVLSPPKTKRSKAPVPLTAACATALRLWRAESGGSGFVFPKHGSAGEVACRPERDLRDWHALCDRAGVRRLPRYGARGAVATALLADGEQPRVIADTLRHANVTTAQEHYARTTDPQVRAALEQAMGQLGLPTE